jgi:hypothetical protein
MTERRFPRPWSVELPVMTDWSDEETDDPLYADRRNFYKVEKWSRDGLRIEQLLYAGNNLDKARRIFERTTKHRPRIRLTLRQRMRVLDEWPRHETILDASAANITKLSELLTNAHESPTKHSAGATVPDNPTESASQ